VSKVRIVQLLCPQRHCVLATAYESPDGAELPEIGARLDGQFKSLTDRGEMNPWCGLCRSRNLHAEDRATRFETMTEAMPHLEELARQNAATREYFRASRG
jgi:thiol-disulfide isomerase/thioredoxin